MRHTHSNMECNWVISQGVVLAHDLRTTKRSSMDCGVKIDIVNEVVHGCSQDVEQRDDIMNQRHAILWNLACSIQKKLYTNQWSIRKYLIDNSPREEGVTGPISPILLQTTGTAVGEHHVFCCAPSWWQASEEQGEGITPDQWVRKWSSNV